MTPFELAGEFAPLAFAQRAIDAGKLAVHVAKSFPLDQAGAAHAFLATRPIGKVALTV
ncbi:MULTISPECIES: zinc-binding dehydrogenase [unclassified Mesorhizobium]|uniref:zinc-binding dehydrogenase n=1 Tax=unclassified Mesorhizobium TaxID=325217 RepID=UPI002961F89F|nr:MULTISPECIES: zinc-binding dehydrogenase [unclassified Mesorhizobium]